ncbi:LynF/TruF/PatF family peptide O-prenyltransferase [Anabaenopsis elenkinii]|uniref:LynF/TruF/PatF family peptide O-prenyltransferase n=1 Tax=Anabaenopsis elenkinii CCIBt3563 TaxID=2779889 RepID=A0A7S6U6K9_9CYAN|nr:LynF/TruF/PatF family peptide O-prenyltransferase [Anabaenopsis elenkinii]QOV23248.1 LynF/TruF/PatF family peptide O-prenyltransferase [Anabaenopsis elenkinii CCIBt3563]
MVSNQNLNNINHNIRYINEHKQAFDIEYFYPLDIFEDLAGQAQNWGIECSCKIDHDRFYPARFNFFPNKFTFKEVSLIFDLFRRVETRCDVKLDYRTINKFLGNNFDFSKVTKIVTGVDLRENFSASRLKFWFWIDNYSEKLETAISLVGDREDLRLLYVKNSWLVGFDFYLNGKSTIELYPSMSKEELQRLDVKLKLSQVLSAPAFNVLDNFSSVLIGFTQENQDRLIYGYLISPNEFIDNLQNDIANKVNSFYRGKNVLNTMICFKEKELIAGSLDNFNLYYQMS